MKSPTTRRGPTELREVAGLENLRPEELARMLITQDAKNRGVFLDSEKHSDKTDVFFSHLINETDSKNSSIYELSASALGYDFDIKRMAILVNLKDFEDQRLAKAESDFEKRETISRWKGRIREAIQDFFTHNHDVITAYVGGGSFLVLKATENEQEAEKITELLKKSFKSIFDVLKESPSDTITVGYSNPYKNISGMIEAGHEARLALTLGSKLGRENGIHYYDDFGVLAALAQGNLEKNAILADRILGLVEDETLKKTLKTFLDQNLSITDTSEALKVHRNTVIYRLDQISNHLGLDPRIFKEAVVIKMAYYIKQLVAS